MPEQTVSKSEGTQTDSIPFIFSLDPAYIEYGRSGLLLLVFLVAMWARNRRTWILVDTVAVCVFGLAFMFIPEKLLTFQVVSKVKIEGIIVMLCRTFGSFMIGSGLSWFFLRKSTDNYTQVMLLATRVVGNSALLVSMYVARTQGKLLNEQFVRFGVLGAVLWTLGSALYFLAAKNYGGHTQLDSWLNFHLRFDFFLSLMFGLFWYSYPALVLKMHVPESTVKINDVHVLLEQAVGAMLIGSAILSAVAPGFMFHEDKRNVLLCRILTIILVVVTSLSSLDHSDIDKSVMLGHLVGVTWLINAGLGYFAPHETDGYWSGRNRANKKD
ncbi:uncharacterized protein LOC110987547 [Acanthaster planci]|uniref:Uncharacterized protein LOC110987547 n=1 Tax=Acanthaster planci TaxID=133434 RepID=A0A8B7ZMD1_ACAPL|nr:uncharacterized protein LOC110987547 [Acanthaster planci]